ncbi:MAG: hypothetical protein ACK56I_17225, partial [bacterium]
PFMCLEQTPQDRPDNSRCTCWARTGGEAVIVGPEPLLPKDVCNPLGEYTRFDREYVTPDTAVCCAGLMFGCLDSIGGTSCAHPNGDVIKFCYDPRDPLWHVNFPRPVLVQ